MPASSFNTRTALFLAALCHQTYVQFDSPEGSFIVPCGYRHVLSFTAEAFHNTTETFGFLLESEHQIIIAFRGSATPNDWVSNGIARQISDGGKAGAGSGSASHQGFTRMYASASEQIRTALLSLSPDKELMITGHSLGGALATLCATDTALRPPRRKPVVYTFASPRVGNPEFARLFNRSAASSIRIVNPNDVVPHVPPLVYRSPATKELYYYLHVRGRSNLPFEGGSVSANHALTNYYTALASLDPACASELQSANPGLCPVVTETATA
ncbi:lipase family protein [Paenibacillus rigui]|uniref:Lipase n=1 Tax=Paenibacillus rigui TaxID=554312 RepID=A0A229UNK2_9BACL|nr:lipase family protein [Paenibacillus rigui]OXM84895.1 lipase [Paenibacillus rigui]